MHDYHKTPYKKLPNGQYDQPELALPRVELRCVFDKVVAAGLVAGVMALGVTSYCFGRSVMPEPMSGEELSAHLYLDRHFVPPSYDIEAIQEAQNTDDVISFSTGAAALLLAIGGGISLAFRMEANKQRRSQVRRDVADGMMVISTGELVQRAAWEALNKPAKEPVAQLTNVALKGLPYDNKATSQITSAEDLLVTTNVSPH